jgi:sugar lactone lactonase YvrE
MIPALCLVVVCLVAPAGAVEAQCHADGDIQFVCGPVSPEDMVPVPDTPWLLVSGMEDDGYLYATDTRNYRSTVLFPTATYHSKPDVAFSGCSGPVTGGFRPHGLSLRPGARGRHTLYVVRHGAREAIEVFDVDARGATPTLSWVGCVVAPDGVTFNSVAALPGGGLAATHFNRPMGELWEWQPGSGWSKVPGSETNGPNGLVASADGRWFYIGGWGTQSLIRLSRGQTPVQQDSVDVGFHIDNVRWAPDGSLLAAGHAGETPESIFQCLGQQQCEGVTSRVARVDPERLTAEEIVRYPSNEHFILGTVGLQVGDEIWLGGIGGVNRIARFAAP